MNLRIKIVLDVLPKKMDSEGTDDGLKLIQKDYDHAVYEIKSTKKIVFIRKITYRNRLI